MTFSYNAQINSNFNKFNCLGAIFVTDPECCFLLPSEPHSEPRRRPVMAPESMKKRIDQLLEKSPFAGLSADLKLALKSQLRALITEANLITREEFEIQSEALQRASARLALLEERLSKLEKDAD
ncbi:MAG: hypothetical protein CMI00_00590 [Oceanospirillaceae bacterium]|nr:hypothetical protein [Oceanospirillaceae bacterium]